MFHWNVVAIFATPGIFLSIYCLHVLYQQSHLELDLPSGLLAYSFVIFCGCVFGVINAALAFLGSQWFMCRIFNDFQRRCQSVAHAVSSVDRSVPQSSGGVISTGAELAEPPL